MRLKVLLPSRTLLDRTVSKVRLETSAGSYGLRPRHLDLVAPLVPGVIMYEHEGSEQYVATSSGVAVKVGEEVLVSVRDAVLGSDLDRLGKIVHERLRHEASHQDRSRQFAARLESTLVRRSIELGEQGGGDR